MSGAGEKISGLLWLLGIATVFVACAGIISLVSNRPAPPTVAPMPPTASNFIPAPTMIPVTATLQSPVPTVTAITFPQEVMVVDIYGKKIEPLADVVVRVGNSPPLVMDENNKFQVQACNTGQFIWVWAPGYEIGSKRCDDLVPPFSIPLNHLDAVDNTNYVWSSAINDCNLCHGNQANPDSLTGATFDEMNEWFHSGHAKVFKGRYFESMYMGTTVNGKLGVPAQPVIIGNEWVPVPPELNQDYHGPGFKLDFPQQPGNCAYCHVPAAVSASQQNAELAGHFLAPIGVPGEGVTCDVCHKAFDVILADNGFPFADRPGVLSFRFLRPNNGVFMLGPFSNMLSMKNGAPTNHRLACTPLYSQSEFCAPCHYGKFGDMVIYNSYGEWKASPYAANFGDPSYRTCQDCHMSHMDVNDTSSLWSQRRACYGSDPRFQNFDHNMMNFGVDAKTGKEILRMVQNAAEIKVNVASQATGSNALEVLVNVTNVRAGHNFPTDSPLRHLILVVRAEDRVGTPLIQVGGGQVPKWAGPRLGSNLNYVQILRNSGVEDYSGWPGKIFANLLVDEETNLSPSAAYWNETKSAFVNAAAGVTSDNRLRPRVTDASTYSFAVPDAGEVKIVVQLIYRFAFYDLLLQKEWFDRPDILVTEVECYGPPRQPEILMQSCRQIAP